MDKVQKFPKTNGDAVFVTDPNKSGSNNDTSLNSVLASIEAGDATFAESDPVSDVAVGAMDKGTAVAEETVIDVLKKIIYVEYAPLWTDASLSITPKNGSILEVGSVIPESNTDNFTVSGSTASAKGGSNEAYGGAAGEDIITSSDTTNEGTAKTIVGSVTYTASRTYAAGTDVVKTAKGTVTNKTAANATTKLENATVNSKVDSTAYTIKSIDKTASVTIKFVYPLYFNDSVISTMSKKLAEVSATGTAFELDYPAETKALRQAFSIPSSYSATVQFWNSLANGGQWEDFDISNFTQTAETKTMADGTTSVAYTKYTCADSEGGSGARKFKVTIKKA